MRFKKDIVVSHMARTPFAQVSKGLSSYEAHELGMCVAKHILQKSNSRQEDIDGLIVGECFSSQPNAARVISSMLELPVELPALTVSNNCVSSMEALAEAARRIELGEGKHYLTLGQESLTSMPFVVRGARRNKKTATLEKLKSKLPGDLPEGVRISDTLEDGLGDGETSFGMHVTAEVLAQNYELSREVSDKIAYQSFKRAYDATVEGKYKPFLVPMKDPASGEEIVDDEAVLLRKGIVENPGRMQKAMLLFDNPVMKFAEFQSKYKEFLHKSHGPTVTMFNACPRSDGASGAFLSHMETAQALGLEPQVRLSAFHMRGVHPNYMGLGQAEASLALLKEMSLEISDIDQIEIHEAFAATAISALEEVKKRTNFDWEKAFDEGRINAYGGSIALGHPFGATGIRLVGNAIMSIREKPEIKRILITACAHGGVGGAMLLEKI